MSNPGIALQKAIYDTLAEDGELVALLGGARIFDDVPRGIRPPYVTIGESLIRDWSTGSEDGHEHFLTVNVWTASAGVRDVHRILDRVEALLDDAALSLDEARLVSIRHEFSDVRREPDEETSRAIVRFRAVTEAAP